MSSMSVEDMPLILRGKNISLRIGMANCGDYLEEMFLLFEELQISSVDAADPEVDIISFSEKTALFAVIVKEELKEDSIPVLPNQSNPSPEGPKLESNRAGIETSILEDTSGRGFNWFDDEYSSSPPREVLGLVYLLHDQSHQRPYGNFGVLNIGIILKLEHRGYGYAHQTVDLVLSHAFDTMKCHRIQALIKDTMLKEKILALFIKKHFEHEGTRRRSYYSFAEQEWKDTTCLALLDTQWVMRDLLNPTPMTLWDELLLRHAREREQLLRWDDQNMFFQRQVLETFETNVPSASSSCTITDTGTQHTESESLHTSFEHQPSRRQTPYSYCNSPASSPSESSKQGRLSDFSISLESSLLQYPSVPTTTHSGSSSEWELVSHK